VNPKSFTGERNQDMASFLAANLNLDCHDESPDFGRSIPIDYPSPDKSDNRTSGFWPDFHFSGNGVNRPSAATACFEYFPNAGAG
jgi:hypothetical protein